MKMKFATLIMASVMGLSCIAGFAGCGGDTNSGGNGGTGGNEQTQEHTLVAHAAKDATCTEAGNKAYWECTDCGKLFSDKDGESETTLSAMTIAAKGHTLEKTEGTSATCKDDGTITYWTCTTCNKLYSDEDGKTEIDKDDTIIPATGEHTFGEWLLDGAGHWKECSVCGDITEKTEHDFGDGLTCTDCGYEYDPAKDTAPTTIEELFPDETTATAIELARAEYYQSVAKENLYPVYLTVLSRANAKEENIANYKWDLGEIVEGKVQNLKLAFTVSVGKYSDYDVYKIKLPTPIAIKDLFNENTFNDMTIPRGNISNEYLYGYDHTLQGDKDEFIKAVAAKLDPDFPVNENTVLLYKETSGMTTRGFQTVLINDYGIREFNIAIPKGTDDDELVDAVDNLIEGVFKTVDFGKYQIDVDLTVGAEEQ